MTLRAPFVGNALDVSVARNDLLGNLGNLLEDNRSSILPSSHLSYG